MTILETKRTWEDYRRLAAIALHAHCSALMGRAVTNPHWEWLKATEDEKQFQLNCAGIVLRTIGFMAPQEFDDADITELGRNNGAGGSPDVRAIGAAGKDGNGIDCHQPAQTDEGEG